MRPTLVTPWTVVHQAPLFMGFSNQEYWSGLPFPSLGDLPDGQIEATSTVSPTLLADSLPTVPPGKPTPYAMSLLILYLNAYWFVVP